MRLKLCSVAYTCSCAAQKVGLHRAATRSIGTHASSVMRAGWKCAWGVPSRGRADVGYKKPDKPPPADPGLKNAGHGREADEPLRKRRLLRPPKLAGQRRKECFRATADCPLLARNTRGTCFEMCVTGREALTQAIRLRRERFVYAKLSVVSHSGFFIIWRRIESSNYDFYFWAWVECASVSARRKASKSAQMRVVVLPSRVLTTGSSLFDE